MFNISLNKPDKPQIPMLLLGAGQTPIPDKPSVPDREPTMAELAETLYKPLDSSAGESPNGKPKHERIMIPVTIESSGNGYARLSGLFRRMSLEDFEAIEELLREAKAEKLAELNPVSDCGDFTGLTFSDALTRADISLEDKKAIANAEVLTAAQGAIRREPHFDTPLLLEAQHG